MYGCKCDSKTIYIYYIYIYIYIYICTSDSMTTYTALVFFAWLYVCVLSASLNNQSCIHMHIHAYMHAYTCIVFTRAKSIMHIHAYNHTCATLFGPDIMQTARHERIVGRVDAYPELQACMQGIQARQTGKADKQSRQACRQACKAAHAQTHERTGCRSKSPPQNYIAAGAAACMHEITARNRRICISMQIIR